MKLYGYWRSNSSYRLRIALNLKNVPYEQAPVHLVRDGGEQLKPAYRAINPQARVPSLVLDDGTVLIQSPAIIEWLEETHPTPPLLPGDPVARAKVRGVASIIGADVHALHNSGPLGYLRKTLGQGDEAVSGWVGKWIGDGLAAIETLIGDNGYCFALEPGLADCYLIPTLYTARRFGVPLDAYPKVLRVDELAAQNPAFQAAHPAQQPDAE